MFEVMHAITSLAQDKGVHLTNYSIQKTVNECDEMDAATLWTEREMMGVMGGQIDGFEDVWMHKCTPVIEGIASALASCVMDDWAPNEFNSFELIGMWVCGDRDTRLG